MLIDLKKCIMRIKDGTSGTQNTLTIKIGAGNMNWTEKKTREYIADRGVLDAVRDADQEPLDLSFEFMWEFLKAQAGDSVPTIEEAIKGIGKASTWVSSDPDTCQPYAVDIEIEHDPSCTGELKEFILFPDFRYEQLAHDLRAGTVSCSGRCNVVEPTITRET
jgi:hypothetical protein